MSFIPRHVLMCALFIVAGLAVWAPVQSTKASTDLVIGGAAVIADAQGDNVRLRTSPSLDGGVIGLYPEGTSVTVIDGLFESSDGSLWWEIEIDGETGYMISDYLSESGSAIGSATVNSALNLRAGPSTSDSIILVMDEGSEVSITGSSINGFLPVVFDGNAGWAYSEYLDQGSGNGAGESAVTTSDLNLRAGPSTSDDVLLVMPPDATVTLTGDSANGFLSVEYGGTPGWAFADYLATGDGNTGEASGEVAIVDSSLNLRAGPSTGDPVLFVMPGGAEVTLLGDQENGFYAVDYQGTDGWAFGEYLLFDGESGSTESWNIVWPVSGGEWEISQGYNGFSHYNGGGGYQYAYSFDIYRTDGGTAGQDVYSPVSGVVRWTERASGGMTIDMGNGYAVAFFHVTVDRGWQDGESISQGDYVGYISGPGGEGYVDGFAHLHLTVWETSDGGNWSRGAIPFAGSNAISGVEYPSSGAYSQWAGTLIYP